MPKYIIEREMPGAGSLGPEQIRGAAQHSNEALSKLPGVQWLESYVTDNKVFCVYIAPDEESIREHARMTGFPANAIREIKTMIDPTAGEGAASAH
jgi:hypothetical protein